MQILQSSFQKEMYIGEYVGEVRKPGDFAERMNTVYSKDTHHYGMVFERGLVIDAYRKGNILRYVNHACKPNCQMQKWIVNGVSRMALYAIEDIAPNAEITYDYKFTRYNPNASQIYYCGSENCREIL